MRDMVRVVTVKEIEAIPEKDKIQIARFNEHAYEAIVPKSIKVGDKAIWFEADSILPEKPEFEFLRKRCYKEALNGFLIKAMKMCGIKSWGLVMLPNEVGLSEKEIEKLKSGQDLTERLEVRKYEPIEDASPTSSSKRAYPKWVKFCLSHFMFRWIGKIWMSNHQNSAGGFPDNIVLKSDETTVQNMPSAIEKFADELVYITCKMEGQSATTCFDPKKSKKDGIFYPCSRNNAYKIKCNNDFWTYCVNNDIEKKVRDYYKKTGKLLAIQAEQCGPCIQDNIYNFKTLKWFVYLMTDIITGNQLSYEEMKSACKDMGLTMVPVIVDNVKLKDVMPTIEAAVEYAEKSFWTLDENGELVQNYQPKNGEKLWVDYFQNEGVVVRSMNCDKKKNIGLSMKVKNLSYNEQGLGKIHNAAATKASIKK